MTKSIIAALLAMTLVSAPAAWAAEAATDTERDADNTGRNVRDRDDATLTPGDQGSSETDLKITQQIRRALTDSDDLSVNAKNVKIITLDGVVTLRGPVASPQEREAIAKVAQSTNGVQRVDNQLEVDAD